MRLNLIWKPEAGGAFPNARLAGRHEMAQSFEVSSYATADAGYGALRRGAIDLYVDGLPDALEEVSRAGSRILAVTSRERAGALPQVPAFGEHGPDEDFSSFVAIVIARTRSSSDRKCGN